MTEDSIVQLTDRSGTDRCSLAYKHMNIAVFIIFMATLALVDGLYCLDNQRKDRYDKFICKHVLQRSIADKTKKTAWTT
ncbi:hypothetical protein NQZ68_028713 [Dissostichus eleginoides]|nr:hypothetical protein NQZ68_028713 [Dissostichus eleginoides]